MLPVVAAFNGDTALSRVKAGEVPSDHVRMVAVEFGNRLSAKTDKDKTDKELRDRRVQE
jgi:hypothetical protein